MSKYNVTDALNVSLDECRVMRDRLAKSEALTAEAVARERYLIDVELKRHVEGHVICMEQRNSCKYALEDCYRWFSNAAMENIRTRYGDKVRLPVGMFESWMLDIPFVAHLLRSSWRG